MGQIYNMHIDRCGAQSPPKDSNVMLLELHSTKLDRESGRVECRVGGYLYEKIEIPLANGLSNK